MKSVVIFGQGYVGSAYKFLMERSHNVIPVDPYKGINPTLHWALYTDYFVCVDTPSTLDGFCDVSAVESVLDQISENVLIGFKLVHIKSTVDPTMARALQTKYSKLGLVFNPEFLTAKNNLVDVVTQDNVILGCDPEHRPLLEWSIHNLWKPVLPNAKYHITGIEEACLAKYTVNSFLATKVTFFNQIRENADTLGIDYNEVAKLAGADRRIGTSHTASPGPDGKFGWGGHCFEKDVPAIINSAKHQGADTDFLSAMLNTNKRHRNG